MKTHIYAYTDIAAIHCPDYVNVSRNDETNKVDFTVRGGVRNAHGESSTSISSLSKDEAIKLANSILNFYKES